MARSPAVGGHSSRAGAAAGRDRGKRLRSPFVRQWGARSGGGPLSGPALRSASAAQGGRGVRRGGGGGDVERRVLGKCINKAGVAVESRGDEKEASATGFLSVGSGC